MPSLAAPPYLSSLSLAAEQDPAVVRQLLEHCSLPMETYFVALWAPESMEEVGWVRARQWCGVEGGERRR